MSEQQFTIADLEQMVADHEASAIRVKAIINELCVKSGLAVRYTASELERKTGGSFKIRSDQFHGRPLATCVRELLEMRRNAGIGPATTNEVFDSLVEGAYEVGAKNNQIARVSLYNSLNKNPAFYKLPNKKWGLREWYPNVKSQPEIGGDEDADTEKPKKSATKKATARKKPKKSDATSASVAKNAPQDAPASTNGVEGELATPSGTVEAPKPRRGRPPKVKVVTP